MWVIKGYALREHHYAFTEIFMHLVNFSLEGKMTLSTKLCIYQFVLYWMCDRTQTIGEINCVWDP